MPDSNTLKQLAAIEFIESLDNYILARQDPLLTEENLYDMREDLASKLIRILTAS